MSNIRQIDEGPQQWFALGGRQLIDLTAAPIDSQGIHRRSLMTEQLSKDRLVNFSLGNSIRIQQRQPLMLKRIRYETPRQSINMYVIHMYVGKK